MFRRVGWWVRFSLLGALIPGAALLETSSCSTLMGQVLVEAAKEWDAQQQEEHDDLGDWIGEVGDFFDSDNTKG